MTPTPRSEQTYCVIVPAYMEQRMIAAVVRRIRDYARDVVVVDDGSADRTREEALAAGAVVLRHERNRGKGMALNTGFAYAREHGFDYLITLDANAQHDPADIPRFRGAYIRTGIPVLIGNRMAHPDTLPCVRRWTNRLMSSFLCRQMGQYLPDTQCGFRLYRCDVIPFVSAEAQRYAAESEILLRVAARGIRMDSLPILVLRSDAKSRFRPIRDTLRFFLMLYRDYRRRHRRRNPERNLTADPDSPRGRDGFHG